MQNPGFPIAKTNETKSLELLKDKTIKVMTLWYQLQTECEQILGNCGQCRTLATIPAWPPSLLCCQSLERRVWRENKQEKGGHGGEREITELDASIQK